MIRFEGLNQNDKSKDALISSHYSTIEKTIPISEKESNELIEKLQNLKSKIKSTTNQKERVELYSECLQILRDYNILPESFTVDSLLKTTEELNKRIYQDTDKTPRILEKILTRNEESVKIQNNENNSFQPLANGINNAETRLDFGSVFFVLNFLSEMTPWNMFIPILIADGNEIEINLADLPIGQALIQLFPDKYDDYSFIFGWTAGIGYAELLLIPGFDLIGGQASFSWPTATPMYLYIYAGASIIIPIAYGTCSITILLDKGPKQVPVPLIDVGLFGSIATVHMPYEK